MKFLFRIVVGAILTLGAIYLFDNYAIVEKTAPQTETSGSKKPKMKRIKVFGCKDTNFVFEVPVKE